jgi:hypothetical protein
LAPLAVVKRAGGFCADMRWFEDWDLWWRVGLEMPALVPVAHLGAFYRRHPDSQLATTKLADRARGHAVLMARMTHAFLERPEMLAAHGEPLFWSGFTAVRLARVQKVAWPELAPLEQSLFQLSRGGPPEVTGTRLARTIRVLGVRTATRLYALTAERMREARLVVG